MKVTLVTHAVMVDGRDNFGSAHNVAEFLAANCEALDFVLHPLLPGTDGLVRRFEHGQLVRESRLRHRAPFRLGEAFSGIRRALFDSADVTIIVDPVNFATHGLLRRRGIVVYYTVDYADRRFENAWLNRLYHLLDRAAVRSADVVWSVSPGIAEVRRDQGLRDEDHFLVPNAPAFDPEAVVPFDRRPEQIVFVGAIDDILDRRLLLDGLMRLHELRPDARATIVGPGADDSFRRELESRGLNPIVQLTGHLPRAEALAIVRESRVGIAFYSGAAAWNAYGDSVKVREYLSLGVPVVTTGNHSIAAELESRGAGIVVTDGLSAGEALARLLGPDGNVAAERAAELGRDNDRDTRLATILEDLSGRVAR